MSTANVSTFDRIQQEIKESIQREKELKNGYSRSKADNFISAPLETIEIAADDPSDKSHRQPNLNRTNTNGFRKYTQNTSSTKGVMHKFIKSRGRLGMSAMNANNNYSNWSSDAAFKPAKMTVEKGGKPLRNGYVSAEEKMKRELQEFQEREAQLRKERRKSQPNLMAALQLEEENEFDNFGYSLNGGLKGAKSMANLYNHSDDGYEDNSSSTGGSLKPARSLAELCDVSDDEGGLPARGVKPVGYNRADGKFVLVPEKIPELIVPDLTDCKFKPYVSYRTPDVIQSEFTAQDLFNVVYAPKIAKDFKEGKLDDGGNPLEPSLEEKLTPEEARMRARQTGSDMF